MPAATAEVSLLALGRADFARLMGPLQQLLESHAATYAAASSKISRVRWPEGCLAASPV